jgi:uncharacterized membrane protein
VKSFVSGSVEGLITAAVAIPTTTTTATTAIITTTIAIAVE